MEPTPHAWSPDFVLLALPWGVALARATGQHRRALLLRLGVVACASLAPWALSTVASMRELETWSALVSAATALLVALALRARAGAAT